MYNLVQQRQKQDSSAVTSFSACFKLGPTTTKAKNKKKEKRKDDEFAERIFLGENLFNQHNVHFSLWRSDPINRRRGFKGSKNEKLQRDLER